NCKQLRCAVQRTYKGARKALASAEATPTVENFHRFRTRAKRLWYELRILRPINPVVLKNLSDDLRAMANLLGRAHDLSFLGDRLRGGNEKSEWEREGHKLLAVIEVSRATCSAARQNWPSIFLPSVRAISGIELPAG